MAIQARSAQAGTSASTTAHSDAAAGSDVSTLDRGSPRRGTRVGTRGSRAFDGSSVAKAVSLAQRRIHPISSTGESAATAKALLSYTVLEQLRGPAWPTECTGRRCPIIRWHRAPQSAHYQEACG